MKLTDILIEQALALLSERYGQLPPGRTEELKQQILKEGMPL
ncbi:MAG TPA: hypothetical protein VE844_17415 [Gammaproteobacteria bacterium]|nr:hypothetical protein [Gammaproteobacteria bacterium]